MSLVCETYYKTEWYRYQIKFSKNTIQSVNPLQYKNILIPLGRIAYCFVSEFIFPHGEK